MAIVVADRVKEVTNSSGLGNFVLAGADLSYKNFSQVCVLDDTFSYCAVVRGGSDWEIGIGRYNTLDIERVSILASSNSNLKVDFEAGAKDVFITSSASVLSLITKAPDKVILGRSGTGEGPVSQLTVAELLTMLNLDSSNIQNLVSSTSDNRAILSNGVYVPEITLDLVAIYTSAKV